MLPDEFKKKKKKKKFWRRLLIDSVFEDLPALKTGALEAGMVILRACGLRGCVPTILHLERAKNNLHLIALGQAFGDDFNNRIQRQLGVPLGSWVFSARAATSSVLFMEYIPPCLRDSRIDEMG